MQGRVLARELGFTEGPVITQSGEFIVTSIDHGCLYRITEDGATVLAVTGGGPNGATEGSPEGQAPTIFVSQNGGRRPGHKWPFVTGGIQIVRSGGRVNWLTQDPISPNDLCFGPDGLLYCTDPTRGRSESDDGRLWRCDPTTGEAQLLCSLPWYPNGIGFGLEDDAVFVAATGQRRIWRFPMSESGLGQPEVFAELEYGLPDGFAFDAEGNLLLAAVGQDGRPGQIQTYDRDGQLTSSFEPGPHAKYTNLALGADGRMLVTDSEGGSALLFDWPTPGLPLHPFRGADWP
jgi:gluconolactonase